MARKVVVRVVVSLHINLEEGEEVVDTIQEMDYSFDYRPDNAENRVETYEIVDFEVTDSK